jgi:hypothetical protein
MKTTYAIADLHGRFDLLTAALDAISKHAKGNDTLAWRTGRLVVAVFDDSKPGAAVEYIEIKKP